MIKKQMIENLSLNSRINDIFILKDVEFRVRRDNKTVDMFYKISDKTGTIAAVTWNVSAEDIKKYKNLKFAHIHGHVSKRKSNGELQATVYSLTEMMPQDFSDYLPRSRRDLDALMDIIDQKIKSINNSHLNTLLKCFFEDHDFIDRFRKAPAATKVHQPYIGGLLEHTCNLIKICESICQIYSEINRDFLITMAILHDIGKIREYSYEKMIDYTVEGKLIGHIAIGLEMIDQKISKLDEFPQDLALMIKHALISHHGHYEYGSPKLPSTLTAIALHYADEIEAKISGFLNIKDIENQCDENENWSKWIWWLERPVYLGEEKSLKENPGEKMI